MLARLRQFLPPDIVRGVVGAPSSSFDLDRVLDGGPPLVRLPKGVLRYDTPKPVRPG